MISKDYFLNKSVNILNYDHHQCQIIQFETISFNHIKNTLDGAVIRDYYKYNIKKMAIKISNCLTRSKYSIYHSTNHIRLSSQGSPCGKVKKVQICRYLCVCVTVDVIHGLPLVKDFEA